uniref:M48 family metallopeptidase n=1 Tax=Candidatus Ventrenecus sp. TaxID=3085654 RepID=UPI003FEE7E60
MKIVIDNKEIELVIHYKNNKNLYIRARDEKTLEVTCNPFMTTKKIMKVIKENEPKIISMLKQKEKEALKDKDFWYLGKPYQIIYESVSHPYFEAEKIHVKSEQALQKFYNVETERVFKSEVERILPFFKNIPFFTLKIRKMKTRWGVNNLTQKTITLNSELLKKDLDLLDYVIIHELCHFYEANHSANFWRHVEEYYPHYKEARRRLKE